MKKYFRVLMVFVAVGVFLAPNVGQIFAQSNALAITPRKDYTINPGQSVNDTLPVTNQSSTETLTVKLTVVDFTAQDESGTPELLRNESSNTAWSLKDYIDLPEQTTVDTRQTVNIPINITLPSDIGAGSYYSAIEYSAVNPEDPEKVNVAASGVTLVFVKVPGKAKQQLTFEQFGAYVPDTKGNDGSFAGLFFSEQPKVLAYRLTNDGNIAEQPNATIVVKNNSGDTVYTIADANPKDQLALRGQTRRFDACIVPETVQQTTSTGTTIDALVCAEPDLSPGRYTAELSIFYGENGNETREITAQATFWYLPWWFVGLVTAGLLIVVGAGVYIWRRIKDTRSRKTRRK